jgi:AcrR family transcriptional regulator
MTVAAPEKLQRRAERKTRKRDEKKNQIADSAQLVLQELGYANTSLRDIAAKADLSLGSLHYYFEDRTELILHCVKAYKTLFSQQINDAIAGVSGKETVVEAFAEALATSITTDASTHRLWYDMRAQALFDPAFRPVVEDMEHMLIDAVQTAIDQAASEPAPDAEFGYALIDGLFRYHLQKEISKTGIPRQALIAEMRSVLNKVL